MKLIHIGKYYPPYRGGMETYLKELAENTDFEQEVIVSNSKDKTTVDNVNGIKVTRVARKFTLLSGNFSPGLIREIRRSRADIYILHLPNPMAALAYMIAKPKGKLIIVWQSDIIRQGFLLPLIKPVMDHVLKRADIICVASRKYLDSSRQLAGFRKKCVIVPLGIDMDKYADVRRFSNEIRDIRHTYKGKIVLFVGRLISYKGLEYIIRAMDRVKAELLIVGDGPLKNQLKRISQPNVHFLGEVEDVRPYYHACDLFVLPSVERSEAFGLSLLEAIACKKPVISTRLDTGVDSVNAYGTKVKPRDISGLRSAIIKALEKPDTAAVMKNYKHARKNFDIKSVSMRMMNIYNNVYIRNKR
jgi:glycosyltransferase involved in cell wall biosynthesis